MPALLTRSLPALYAQLGDTAQFSHAGGPAVTVPVIYSADGQTVLDGMVQSIGPSLRIQAASAPAGVTRGDVFVLAGQTLRAREAGLPLLDGAELQVPLSLA